MPQVLSHPRFLNGGDLLDHLVTDLLIKAVIIGVGVIVVVAAMVVLWKVLGRR